MTMGKTKTKSRKSDPHTTPAMRQFHRFKEERPDCVLFFRMGDFYETFYDDAVLCHKVLGITLTERTKGVPMAGVPYHAIENYLRRLIEAGHRVAVADQIQDPKEAKGIVDRAVTRVLTPGTLVDEALLDDARANSVAAIVFHEAGDDSNASIAIAELSTGCFEIVDVASVDLLGEIARLGPCELLHVETSTGEPPTRVSRLTQTLECALTPRPSWQFREGEAHEALTEHFGVKTLSGFGLDEYDPALTAAGALIRYFNETQPQKKNGESRLRHLQPPTRRMTDAFVQIDATSLQSLEIERTIRGNQIEGTLLGIFRQCSTPMGKRQLRTWLCFPLRDLNHIQRRQRCVGAMIDDRVFLDGLRSSMAEIQDVARIAGRIAMSRATPRDLVGLGRSLQPIQSLIELIDLRPAFQDSYETLQKLSALLAPLSKRIDAQCVDSPPGHMRAGGLFRDGIDASLDESRLLQRDANAWLVDYQERITAESGIASLKVGFNRVFGYYIEVSIANSSKVPDSFTRKQTLKNAERYITPELKEFETKVLNAEGRAIEREQHLFNELCAVAADANQPLAEFADCVATLDVLACFAQRAMQRGYTCPTMVDDSTLDIQGGKHPVLDELLRDQFVPNDAQLNVHNAATGADDRKTLAIITGPNMAGKSTFIRQVALLTLLAHTGSYIPAESATIGITDRIFTRIGASDELHAGRSTFMVEMTETAIILHHATPRSLVILDEIGRGTSTLDGLSLAWAIVEQLAEVGPRTFFATHYHELTSINERLPNVCNLNVAVREWEDEIIFLYRILPGKTDRSYGIHVAKIAGVPTNVIDRANQLLATLEVQTGQTPMPAAAPPPTGDSTNRMSSDNSGQMALFTEFMPHPVINELKAIPIESLSPLEAFDLLRRLQKESQSD